MKKLLFLLLITLFVSCDNTQPKKRVPLDLPMISSFLTTNKFPTYDGVMTFEKNGKCKFFKRNKRTSQVEYNFYGTYLVDKTKFEDNGETYWYVDIDWDRRKIISDFYVVNRAGFLVEASKNDRRYYTGEVYRDNYGPILNSWNYRNQDYDANSRALRPVDKN